MEECLHRKTKPFSAQKEYLGKVFTYDTEKCESCGATFWTKAQQQELNQWLNKLKSEDQLMIQKLKLSPATQAFVEATMERLSISYSSVIKGTLSFYCSIILPNEKLVDFTDEAFEKVKRENFESSLKTSKTVENKKVRLGIPLYLKVYGLAKLTDLSVTAFVEDATERALAPMILAQINKSQKIEQRFIAGFDACLGAAA